MPETFALNTTNPATTYKQRQSVRCLITRGRSEICIIHIKAGNHYKLPGGRVEPSDSNETAACKRVALDEAGCDIAVHKHFDTTSRFRGDTENVNRAYVCVFERGTGPVRLRAQEIEEGFVHEWTEVDEALKKMKEIVPTSEMGLMIQKRDVWLVEKFKTLTFDEMF